MDGSEDINPNSLTVLQGYVEQALENAKAGDKFQFFRHGYFAVDSKFFAEGKLVFNRTVALKSSFKI